METADYQKYKKYRQKYMQAKKTYYGNQHTQNVPHHKDRHYGGIKLSFGKSSPKDYEIDLKILDRIVTTAPNDPESKFNFDPDNITTISKELGVNIPQSYPGFLNRLLIYIKLYKFDQHPDREKCRHQCQQDFKLVASDIRSSRRYFSDNTYKTFEKGKLPGKINKKFKSYGDDNLNKISGAIRVNLK